jgi:hypothetical protein
VKYWLHFTIDKNNFFQVQNHTAAGDKKKVFFKRLFFKIFNIFNIFDIFKIISKVHAFSQFRKMAEAFAKKIWDAFLPTERPVALCDAIYRFENLPTRENALHLISFCDDPSTFLAEAESFSKKRRKIEVLPVAENDVDDATDIVIGGTYRISEWRQMIDAKYQDVDMVSPEVLDYHKLKTMEAVINYKDSRPYPDFELKNNRDQAILRDFPNYVADRARGVIYNIHTGKTLSMNKDGRVTLRLNGKRSTVLMHREILKTFFPLSDDLPTIDHIDRDPTNNAESNLRYANQKLQMQNRDNKKGGNGSSKKIIVTKEGCDPIIYDSLTRIIKYGSAEYKRINKQLRKGTATWNGHIIQYWKPEGLGEFKPIPSKVIHGAEGYFVSEFCGWVLTPSGLYTQGCRKRDGRYRIYTGKHHYYVHRLQGAAFHGDITGFQINHLNGLTEPSDISNLEISTASENMQHAHDTGLIKLGKPIVMLKNDIRREFKSMADAVWQLGLEGIKVDASCIGNCCNGRHKTHAGAVWMFV